MQIKVTDLLFRLLLVGKSASHDLIIFVGYGCVEERMEPVIHCSKVGENMDILIIVSDDGGGDQANETGWDKGREEQEERRERME